MKWEEVGCNVGIRETKQFMQACWRILEPMSSQNGDVFFLCFSEYLRVSCNTDMSLCKLFTGVVVMLAYIRRWTMSARSRCRKTCLCWRRLAAAMVLGAIAAKPGVVGCHLPPEMNTRPIPNVSGLAAILQKLTFTITLRFNKVKFKPNHTALITALESNYLLHNITFIDLYSSLQFSYHGMTLFNFLHIPLNPWP